MNIRSSFVKAALGGLLAFFGRGAGSASTFSIGADPRIELLGVVQFLAGRGGAPEVAALFGLEGRFGRYRDHPAVKSYAKIAARGEGVEPLGLILTAATDPPRLALKIPPSRISSSFWAMAGGVEAGQSFIAELGAFARESKFMEFYESKRGAYEGFAAQAKKELGDRDYLKLIEEYSGSDLDCRARLILSMTYDPRTYYQYIIPYPYGGPRRLVKGPYDVFTLWAPREFHDGVPQFALDASAVWSVWKEAVYLLVEAAFVKHEDEVEAFAALREPVADACPGKTWGPCSRAIVAAALQGRLQRKISQEPTWSPGRLGEYERFLSARLAEYENGRGRYKTFLDFFPRMVAGFRDLAAGAPGPATP